MQRWIRLDEPKEGWWPWGWIPLVGLLCLFVFIFVYFAEAGVESIVQRNVRQRLTDASYGWATVEANGQEVLITGSASTAVSRETVQALAQTTSCPTWLGRMMCPTRVRVDIRHVSPPPAKSKPSPNPTRQHDFSFEKSSGVVALTGEVPSEDDRRRLVERAQAIFKTVEDRLRVTGARWTMDDDKACRTAIELLAHVVAGRVDWENRMFGASGVVVEGAEAEVDRLLKTFENGHLGEITLLHEREANACDDAFAARLQTQIQFATNSAQIQPASRQLLRSLADIALRCPVTLQIEGHTDSTGSRDWNQQLSRQRAESVKRTLQDMKVDDDKLVATGFGHNRPIGDNRTPQGRAKNRRIEIKVRR